MQTPAQDTRIRNVCLIIITGIAITYFLKVFSVVLIPFVLAIFLTYCLTPFIELQIRVMKIPRYLAIITTIFIGCLALFLIGLLVSSAVGEITRNVDAYQEQMEMIYDNFMNWLKPERFGVNDTEIYGNLRKTVNTVFTGIANSVKAIVSNGMLVIIFMMFMISGKNVSRTPSKGVKLEIETSIKRYSITLVVTSAMTGALVGFTLFILNVDFAWMFGFLAFLLNFIPSIGSIIATLLPIPVVILSQDMPILSRVLAILIPSLVQFSIGNLVQPRLMGKSLNLHPVTVLISLMFFGALWGVVGMFLATPITAVVRMLFEKFEYTHPVAMIMAGNLDSISK